MNLINSIVDVSDYVFRNQSDVKKEVNIIMKESTYKLWSTRMEEEKAALKAENAELKNENKALKEKLANVVKQLTEQDKNVALL